MMRPHSNPAGDRSGRSNRRWSDAAWADAAAAWRALVLGLLIEALAAVALLAAIAAAITRRVPEAGVALGGAAVLIAVGGLGFHDAAEEAKSLAPTLVVLAS